MADLVTRTFLTTKITFNEIISNGKEVHLDEGKELIVKGKVNNDQALKLVKREYGKNKMFVIGNLDYIEELYACPVNDFLSISKKIERKHK